MRIITKEEAQFMDQEIPKRFGIPLLLLMENAGRDVADEISHFLREEEKKGPVLFLCGVGNNGADGLVAARHLQERGFRSLIYIQGDLDKASFLFVQQFEIIKAMGIEIITSFEDISWHTISLIVEGLMGTGFKGEMRPSMQKLLAALQTIRQEKDVVPLWAIDIPAGIEANTGKVAHGTLSYDRVITFGASKVGMHLYPGKEYCGQVIIRPLGAPWQVVLEKKGIYSLDRTLAKTLLPKRSPNAHKGTNGFALLIGGSKGMIGAPIMASEACFHVGAGKIQLSVPKECADTVAIKVMPEIMIQGFTSNEQLLNFSEGKRAIAIGPGMGRSEVTQVLIQDFIKDSKGPLVVDADGLYALGKMNSAWIRNFHKKETLPIFTPHLGEFSRLTGKSISEIQEHYIEIAKEFAQTYQVVLVLKGIPSLVALPDGNVFINMLGNSGMGTGGMGDTLTGVITGLLAQGLSSKEAALLGVYLHSASADSLHEKMAWGYTPSQVGQGIAYELTNLFKE